MNESKAYCMNCFSEMNPNDLHCSHCGWSNDGQPQDALPFGTVLCDKYLIGQAVSVNGAGITYSALERISNRKVEVREFFPIGIARREQNVVCPVVGAELKFSDYLSEFERTGRSLMRLSGIEGIQSAINAFSENNTQYVVFAFRESMTLREYVESNGKLSWTECERLFLPVIRSLNDVHSRNIDHLGISPQTLRIAQDGSMFITGFEMPSLRRAGNDLQSDSFEGYWAPEQYSRVRMCDEVTDVYGMSASLMFAVSGAVPPDAQKRQQDPRLLLPRDVVRGLPKHAVQAIANGLQVDANKRTSSFSRLLAELTASSMVVETVVETETLRSLPNSDKRDPKSKSMPPFVMLMLSFVITIVVLMLVTSIWFKDSAFSPQSISGAFNTSEVPLESQTIKLPNLVGKNYDEIKALAGTDSSYAFTLKIYEERFDDSAPEGEILEQLPFAGSMIKAGDTVKVAVSGGQSKRALPDITNAPYETAKEQLEAEGFVPVKVESMSADIPAGNVIGYLNEQPGDVIAHGSVVQVLVSTGA